MTMEKGEVVTAEHFLMAGRILNEQTMSFVSRRIYCFSCDEVHEVTDEDGKALQMPDYCIFTSWLA